jgi:hypothetical protein
MEGASNSDTFVGGSLGGTPLQKGKSRKKKFLIFLLILVLLGAAYAIRLYFRPLYVIDNVSITRQNVHDYVAGLNDYKKNQPNVDFGKDYNKVATDDLVLNAAYKKEMKDRADKSLDKIISGLAKQKRTGSAESQHMQLIRAENNSYQQHLAPSILSQRDLTLISISFDTPFFKGKTPEEIKALRQQSVDTLNTKFMPLVQRGLTANDIGARADVNFLDSNLTDDQNYQQYFDKLVSTVDFKAHYIEGISAFNDIPNSDYYGVKVENLKNTKAEIAKLTRAGQNSGVFASQTGAYMIVRLDKIYGGKYLNWDDFLKQYKLKYAETKLLAYDLSPSKAFVAVGNQVVLALTSPGLQKAQADSCNAHGVAFVIKSYDKTAFAEIPGGTTVNQYRAAHNCGSVYTGNRSSSSIILDNCLGPAPTWSVLSYADPSRYTFVELTTSEDFFTEYPGWPNWTSSNINAVGSIFINFYYVQKPPSGAIKASHLEAATCDVISGWIFDSSVPGGIQSPVTVHVYFDAPLGQPGARAYNSGTASGLRTDVGAAFPGVGNNHGFNFNPSTAGIGFNIRDNQPHKAYFYAGNTSPDHYEFASATIPACGPIQPQPQPPVVNVDAQCDHFSYSAQDPDNQTSSFIYNVTISNNSGPSKTFTTGAVTGTQSITPWPPDTISLTQPSGTNWRVKATEQGGGGQSTERTGTLARCQLSDITITEAKPKLLKGTVDDSEDPDSVTFHATFAAAPQAIRGVNIKCYYYIDPMVGNNSDLTGSEDGPQYLNTSYDCDKSVPLPSAPSLVVGDQVCADYVATPGGAQTNPADDTITKVTIPKVEKLHVCATISNRPYVAVYGNDIYAGGGYGVNCTNQSKIRAFTNAGSGGSGVQFAATALGQITGFNSARLRSSTPTPPDGLTFANTDPASFGTLGAAQHCLYDYYSHQDDETPASPLGSATITSFSAGKFKYSGNVTIGDGVAPTNAVTLASGKATSLYIKGNVRIRNNIQFASTSWANPAQVPSFYLIVQGNIYIDPGVTNIDGVYITQPGTVTPPAVSGSMFTCANAGDPTTHQFTVPLRYTNCQKQLTINGGLQAVRVYFDRVGSYSLRDADASENTAATSKAAEIINFTPETYLSTPSIPRESQSGGAQNKDLQVLPPVL